ncbi:MAG: hypothetical protein ACRD00_01795 [Thermoanaerobaculia bacterium]
MNGDRDPMLHWGSGIVALGALGMLAAAAAVLPRQIDPGARVGRHLVAGALSIAALSIVELLVALFALRRGEKWAFWAAAVPVVLVGVPVVIVDATYVSPSNLFATILPQVLGLAIVVVGLTLCGLSLFRPSAPAPP